MELYEPSPDNITYRHLITIIEKDNDYLIVRRKRPFAGYSWCFPGCDIDDHISAKFIARIIREKLGIAVEVIEICHPFNNVLNCRTTMVVLPCRARYLSGQVTTDEYDDTRWIPAQELSACSLSDSDRLIVQRLLQSMAYLSRKTL